VDAEKDHIIEMDWVVYNTGKKLVEPVAKSVLVVPEQ
jgi:hypothetical protein